MNDKISCIVCAGSGLRPQKMAMVGGIVLVSRPPIKCKYCNGTGKIKQSDVNKIKKQIDEDLAFYIKNIL